MGAPARAAVVPPGRRPRDAKSLGAFARTGFVSLPWPGGLPKEGPSCSAAEGAAAAEGRKGDEHEGEEGGDGGAGGVVAVAVIALLLALAALGLVAHGRGWLARCGLSAVRAKTACGLSSTSSAPTTTMNMPLAGADYAAAR